MDLSRQQVLPADPWHEQGKVLGVGKAIHNWVFRANYNIQRSHLDKWVLRTARKPLTLLLPKERRATKEQTTVSSHGCAFKYCQYACTINICLLFYMCIHLQAYLSDTHMQGKASGESTCRVVSAFEDAVGYAYSKEKWMHLCTATFLTAPLHHSCKMCFQITIVSCRIMIPSTHQDMCKGFWKKEISPGGRLHPTHRIWIQLITYGMSLKSSCGERSSPRINKSL